jgi:hypothetical protein
MSTQVAAPIAYPVFSTPPRLCGLPAFQMAPPMAPRQNRHLSLPRITVLIDDLDDSDDEGHIFSYRSLRLKDYERCVFDVFLWHRYANITRCLVEPVRRPPTTLIISI